MVDIPNPKTQTPFQFREDANQVYYHDLKIFIQGADVTPWITSAVNLTRGDRNVVSSLTFQLSNAYRAFEITETNLNLGDPTSKVDEITGQSITRERQKSDDERDKGKTTKGPNTGRIKSAGTFRLSDPYGAGAGYSELAKATIFKNKLESNTNWRHGVAKFGTYSKGNTRGGALADSDAVRDASSATGATTPRYLFTVGSLVFHKYDPVRFFVKNPLSASDDEWSCEFAGYIETKPYSQNYINGHSIVSLTCQDIRTYMQTMRTQTNPVAQIGNEKMLFFGNNKNDVPGTGDAGAFNDLRISGRAGHSLYGQTFVESIKFLLLGVKKNGAYNGRVGKLTEGITLKYDPNDSEIKKKLTLEKWNNIVNFGTYPLPVTDDATPEQPEGATTNATGGAPNVPTKEQEAEQFPKGAAARAGKLGIEIEKFLTRAQMEKMGQETKDGGQFSPDVARVHFLVPPDLGPVSNLIAASMVDARVSVRVEWASRLELIIQLCKAIDYQFYVTGMGDVVFEFPMYDFMPTDFNSVYNNIYTFQRHVVSDSINDEGGTPITALEVTSRILTDELAQGHPSTPGSAPVQNYELRATAFSNVLASRVGVHVETHSLPGITSHARLAQYALLEFNKRLANYNKFDMQVSYRPFIGINRPIYHQTKQRVAICDSFTYSWKIREDVSLEMNLSYVRRLEGENFRFITGGEKQPLSYNTIFDTKKSATHLKSVGVDVFTNETDEKPGGKKKTVQEEKTDPTQSKEANP